MRIALSLAALFLGGTAAFADDIVIRADIAAATLFLSGAEVTRHTEVSLPAGEHRVLIALPDAALADLIGVKGPDGVILGPASLIPAHPLPEGALDDPAQAAARQAVDSAEAALEAARDALALADGGIRAIEAQLAYLAALAGAGGAETDPSRLPQLLAALGAETARLETELHAARIARRIPAEAVADREADLSEARAALARLAPFGTAVDVVALPVSVASPTQGAITLDYFTHAASWAPSHELRLDSESGAVSLSRFVTVTTEGPARWQDVVMRFATTEPDRQRMPSPLWPTPARIMDPSPMPLRLSSDVAMSGVAAETAAAPAMAEPRAALAQDGLSVSFDYATPVSIGPNGQAVLPLDPLVFATETEARAVPRLDRTAFLVARMQNDSGAPILPGPARFFRDGALIGEEWLPLIPAGAEAELGFGPLDHLQLIWIDRALAEGDRGILTTSTTQSRSIAFGVENLSDRPERVRLVYATPFAEQEDLTLELTLSPEPDARDIDDLRGVNAWNLTVPPGEAAMVEMGIELFWPEGQVLVWWP